VIFQIIMSNHYNLSNPKHLHEIDILNQNLHFLKCRTLNSPCITITGFDKLQICPLMKQRPSVALSRLTYLSDLPPIHDVIHKLFTLLNIPHFWILQIENPQNRINPKNYLPLSIDIYLITDNIKMYIYNTLLKYFRHTDQKSVSVKLLIT